MWCQTVEFRENFDLNAKRKILVFEAFSLIEINHEEKTIKTTKFHNFFNLFRERTENYHGLDSSQAVPECSTVASNLISTCLLSCLWSGNPQFWIIFSTTDMFRSLNGPSPLPFWVSSSWWSHVEHSDEGKKWHTSISVLAVSFLGWDSIFFSAVSVSFWGMS